MIFCPKHPTIVVESHIPYLEPLEQVARVLRLAPEEIDAAAVARADALVVRTRTRCDAALLKGSRVGIVATATIGTDHIDRDWCARAGITVANAPGCNAPAVAQYVLSSLAHVSAVPLDQLTLGIVGVGHVGSLVASRARSLGMRVMLCDPPRRRAEGGSQWHSLAELAAEADVITFHTPYTQEGPDATHHLADAAFFDSLRRAPIIVNSARGRVVDNVAWAEAMRQGRAGRAIVDCWEGEPRLYAPLLDAAAVATPHIAGYSVQGKQRASQMVLDALCDYFGFEPLSISAGKLPPPSTNTKMRRVAAEYDPAGDTAALKANPQRFEWLRNHYALRQSD